MLASFLTSYIFETNVTIYQGIRYCHNNTLYVIKLMSQRNNIFNQIYFYFKT